MSLADFLLARIAEDEAAAREAAGIDGGFEGGDREWCPDWLYAGIRHLVRNCDIECSAHEDDLAGCGQPHRYAGEHIARHAPARVLVECDAKRRIVETLADNWWSGNTMLNERLLGFLALPFVDHPDYREEWKP